MATPQPIPILLVEDNPTDAFLLSEYLRMETGPSFALTHVTRLSAAIDHIQRSDVTFRACLLDLALIDATGLEAVNALRKVAPNLALVVLTGNNDIALGRRAMQAGAQDFLSKDQIDAPLLSRSLEYAIERARLQARIARDQTRLRAMVMANPDAMLVVDRDHRVRFTNPAAAALLGQSISAQSQSVPSLSAAEPPPAPTYPTLPPPFPEHLFVGQRERLMFIGTGRRPHTAEMRVSAISWEGSDAFLASLRDYTAEERAEELEARLSHADRLLTIGQLAAGVAHEINNPAAFILTNLGMLKDYTDDLERYVHRVDTLPQLDPALRRTLQQLGEEHELRETFRDIRDLTRANISGIERICALVGNLKAFARIEPRRIEPVDLAEVAKNACKMVASELRYHANLVQDLGPVPEINADPHKLSQVLVNLLLNAIQAIPSGHAQAHTVTVATEDRGDTLTLSVTDTGEGMTREVQRRIFEPFFTTKPETHGTGLGLAFCAETIREHNGTITVRSAPGQGATFTLVFPRETGLVPAIPEPPPSISTLLLDAASSGTSLSIDASLDDDSYDRDRITVLIIDDDTLSRAALRRVIGQRYRTREARSAHDALLLIQSEPDAFSIILCEMMLPNDGGLDLYEQLCTNHPILAQRLLFITGRTFSPRAIRFLMAAAENVPILHKPIHRERLQEVIASVLGLPPT